MPDLLKKSTRCICQGFTDSHGTLPTEQTPNLG